MSSFDTTIPFGEPELMRASVYQRYLSELEPQAAQLGVSSRISSLSPSLRDDLLRFEAEGRSSEVMEVVAACVRHGRRVTLHLEYNERVVPLTVFPDQRLVHSPIPVAQLLARRPGSLRVLHVEPALLKPPGEGNGALSAPDHEHEPLSPVLWALAIRGSRAELLPEIGGPAVYRVAPSLQLHGVPVDSPMLNAVTRLRREPASLREIAEWPGLDRERACRLLNALYLQAGLMVSRSHPDALRDGWFGARHR